jgi:thioesterase domain-containing protein
MAELAATFIDEMLAVQARGPWRLCGYSAGGAVGHEMVRQMQAAGHEVSHLFLIDPYCDHSTDDPAQELEPQDDLWVVCRDMVWDTMGLRGAAADGVVALARRLCAHPTQVTVDEANAILPRTMDLRMFKMLLDGLRNSWFAYAAHRIGPLQGFNGRAWLIQPDADPAALRAQRFGAWRRLIGESLRPIVVPGEHSAMLNRSQSVRAIGASLIEHLQAAAAT